MGATDFQIDNFGKDLNEAYNKQVKSDYYDFGHSGYTGTMVECDGLIELDRPPRITAIRLMETIQDAVQWWWWAEGDLKYRQAGDKPKAECRHAWERLSQWFPPRGFKQGFMDADDICRLYDDKWGPAFGVEQSPAEKKARWHDLPRGSKTFLFFGSAAC